jgi:hypothetical protein
MKTHFDRKQPALLNCSPNPKSPSNQCSATCLTTRRQRTYIMG